LHKDGLALLYNGRTPAERHGRTPGNDEVASLPGGAVNLPANLKPCALPMNRLAKLLPPGNINQLCFGFSETLNAFTWTVAINADPEDPYTAGSFGNNLILPTW